MTSSCSSRYCPIAQAAKNAARIDRQRDEQQVKRLERHVSARLAGWRGGMRRRLALADVRADVVHRREHRHATSAR